MLRTASRTLAQPVRRLSTQAAPPAGGSNRLLVLGAAAVGLGGIVFWSLQNGQSTTPKVPLKSALDKDNFVEFPLKKVLPYNHNTQTFIFELPEGTATLLPVAGCVLVKSDELLGKNGKPVIRPYTPVSDSQQPGELALMIKKYDTGVMSKHVHEMKVGDKLAIKGPITKFEVKANQFDEVALIGGGSGITPLYQILDYALADKKNKTKFKLIFANAEERDILLRETFDGWKRKYPNTFDVVYTLDKPPQGWTGASGYVSKDLIQQHVAPPSLKDKVKIFVCGPPGQVAALAGKKDGMKQGDLAGILKELGYSEEQVFKF
ncbi:ferredoxin reductase-like protein [Auriculariales sp. MPI-PUGE-AT-0066]|nr:ferredoxin reductase-like protein [Auriculariales sp. MPI-PUGE-AT-0066]